VQCTFHANAAATGGSIASMYGASLMIQNTIIAFSSLGEAVSWDEHGDVELTCCDLFGNAGGDWVGPIGGQFGVDGNIAANPLFCDSDNGDFRLHEDSPCAPDVNPECGLIGAWPVGCGPTPVEETSWGAIKAMFRK
jgi:hypothetical protein